MWGRGHYSTDCDSLSPANVDLLVQRPHILSFCMLMKVVNCRYMNQTSQFEIPDKNEVRDCCTLLLHHWFKHYFKVSHESPHCLAVLVVFCYTLWPLSVWCNIFSSFRAFFLALRAAFNAISIYAAAWGRLYFTFCVTYFTCKILTFLHMICQFRTVCKLRPPNYLFIQSRNVLNRPCSKFWYEIVCVFKNCCGLVPICCTD